MTPIMLVRAKATSSAGGRRASRPAKLTTASDFTDEIVDELVVGDVAVDEAMARVIAEFVEVGKIAGVGEEVEGNDLVRRMVASTCRT